MSGTLGAQLELLPSYLGGHVRLTLLTLALGGSFSVALGLALTRLPRARGPVLAAAAVVQTIPGLALLAIMVPLLGRIGFLPALVALTLYSMLPILRNTVVGIDEVDAEVVEAARGVGMTEGQMLRWVQLPLAAPMILAGLRTASAWTVGMATLATPVGAVRLGNFIFSGLQTRNQAAILVGCAAAAGLALTLDAILRGVEIGVRRRRPGLVAVMLALLVGIGLVAGAGGLRRPGGGGDDPVRIGTKPFTEQYILGEALSQRVQARTGHPVDLLPNLGSTVAFDALRLDQIDLYVDYSGTLWATILKHTELPPPAAELNGRLTRELEREYGIRVVGSLGFENAYCLAMHRDRAAELGIAALSDLPGHARSLRFGADMEFLGREEYRALTEDAAVQFGDVRAMDAALLYSALAADQIDVISAYSTEGKIAALDLIVLLDDVNAFPPYDALLLAAPSLQRERPDVFEAASSLVGAIDHASMLQANWSVDEEGQEVSVAARALLARVP